ncbi:cupin domain-containing protein [Bradyrhizobium jicamae]|uniref:Cupin domain-containing protein n=1 Tax=Bradyrhizobium jicamae TaxID=280332 RepID=A0ABS5FUI3_9BRAD|nr:cupin domain-containing protein [Bradyrhizobium jicamae]MBR0800428.1 cupin domain-containing protein [Bradyrhizobium jicamae]
MLNTSAAIQKLSSAKNLDGVYSVLDEVGMGPGWNKPEPSLWPAPRKTFVPAHWSYKVARAALDAAGPLISTELAERRNLILPNPVPGNTYATARTLVAAYQMVRPHETARSHRHTPNALRLVVDADPATYTIVQGKKIPMLPGDVLLTPNWLWHGHSNDSDSNAYWIDFLDAPLVQLLEPMFLEQFPEGIEKADDIDDTSPMRFPFVETRERLDRQAPSADGTHEIELGKPALDTIGLFVRRLSKGRTAPIHTTANNIYAVIDGEGVSTIDGTRYEWARGDVFVAPGWREHTHETSGTAHLLRVTDAPVMERFRWLR